MKLFKTHPLLSLMNSYIVDSPQPANINYFWNFGSLLATCLIIQIVTGITLAMHYTPSVDLAFTSVEHIMRDVNYFRRNSKCFRKMINHFSDQLGKQRSRLIRQVRVNEPWVEDRVKR